jgi:hypothetical protein
MPRPEPTRGEGARRVEDEDEEGCFGEAGFFIWLSGFKMERAGLPRGLFATRLPRPLEGVFGVVARMLVMSIRVPKARRDVAVLVVVVVVVVAVVAVGVAKVLVADLSTADLTRLWVFARNANDGSQFSSVAMAKERFDGALNVVAAGDTVSSR